ncbi:hypothetical protein [Paenibacillus sp. Y412MC10]|uniref:hypothetical protein n=1 Tax=Geobacillus sp. (strain Y412MC10) TaxID=481743 RepID=UPI0011A02B24|nr:hypothetical protein [Paenibacillus sp. Y412MC10]
MRHLETALELDDSRIFSDYAVWLNGILNTYGMETRTLTDNFRYLQQSLSTVDELDRTHQAGLRPVPDRCDTSA